MFALGNDVDKINTFLDEFEKYLINEKNSINTIEKVKNKKLQIIEEKIQRISNILKDKKQKT